jgi:hypothetical protein
MKKNIDFNKIYWHDAVFCGLCIKDISKKGSTIDMFFKVYFDNSSINRTNIKVTFKSVEQLLLSIDIKELYNNKHAGNINSLYNEEKFTFNLFGGLISLTSSKKPKVKLISK